MSPSVKSKSSQDSFVEVATTKTEENLLEKLPDELLVKIFKELSPEDVVSLGKTNRKNNAVSVDDPKRWIHYGVKPPVAFSAMPGAVSDKIKSLPRHVREAIPLLKGPLDLFSSESVTEFSAAVIGMNDMIKQSVEYAERGLYNLSRVDFEKSLEFALRANLSVPSNACDRIMNAIINGAVQKTEKGLFGYAKNGFEAASRFALRTNQSVPSDACDRIMNAIVNGSVLLVERGEFYRAKKGFNTVVLFADKAGRHLPQSAVDLKNLIERM